MSRPRALPAPKRAQTEAAPVDAGETRRLHAILGSAHEHAASIRQAVERALLVQAHLTSWQEDGSPVPEEELAELGQHLRAAYADLYWLTLELKGFGGEEAGK